MAMPLSTNGCIGRGDIDLLDGPLSDVLSAGARQRRSPTKSVRTEARLVRALSVFGETAKLSPVTVPLPCAPYGRFASTVPVYAIVPPAL
jgi:hypothetical protein